jgi:dTDP-4-dehydrorhamnose 3,5-epimerase
MTSLEITAARELPAVRVISPRCHQDGRGSLAEVWRQDALKSAGLDCEFVQENQTLSNARGTVRGLHFQIGRAAQGKLIRCIHGSILDVAVDIRRRSPTFGRHLAIVLSGENWKQLYVPVGFAHGYCTLHPETEVVYKVTAYYHPESERGVAWNDPAIGIKWPVDPQEAVLTERDRAFPPLADLPDFFPYSEFPD